MAKQASKTVIGVFVVGSIAMLIAGVIIFGSGELFKERIKFVMFFEDSVKGLAVGAPVIWHGVEVGSVSSIVLQANTKKLTIDVPVVIEFDPNRVEIEGKRSNNPGEQMKRLIAKGLRAQLGLQSFVTGSSMIQIEFQPDTPVRLTGLDKRYPEIPTVRSTMDKLAQKLEDLPIEKIVAKLVGILETLDGLLKDPEIKEMVHNLNGASKKLDRVLEDADKLVLNTDSQINEVAGNLNNKMNALSDGMQTTLADARTLLKGASKDLNGVSSDLKKLLQNVDGEVKPVMQEIHTVLISAKKAMDGATKTLITVDGLVGDRSDTRRKLNRTLDEFSAAAESLKSLMDYLERHPESLLKGKGGAK
ncbi:MAG TPA: MCE family protein [Deltaproteobacteria bacterium]|nr:MCE family protein [Deltaproteobacteria bacterium]HIJ41728.1 MCE family protein [Deltaproteobacteria bacterium]